MSRRIIVISVCLMILLTSIVFYTCSKSNNHLQEAIIKVLETNYKINSTADKMLESKQEIRNNFNYRYNNMIEIDLNNCPTDFAIAYKEHCDAFKEMIDTCDQMESFKKKYSVWTGIVTGLKSLRGWIGWLEQGKMLYDYASDENSLIGKAYKAQSNILYTYDILLEISSKYNVDTKKYNNIYKNE